MIYLQLVVPQKLLAALIEEMGGEVVGMEFVIELEELKATEKLSKYNIYSQVKY